MEQVLEKLLEPLKKVLAEKAHLIINVDGQTEVLEKYLRGIDAELKESSAIIRRDGEMWREVEQQIRTAVYEIEDAVDRFVILQDSSWCKPLITRRLDISQYVEAIKQIVEYIDHMAKKDVGKELQTEQFGQMIKRPGVSKDKQLVGFEREREMIINRLMKETGELDVISIIGMPGLGKTMLAYKISTDLKIEEIIKPAHRIWVNVLPGYRKKDMLLSILRHLTNVTDDMMGKSDYDISKLVWEKLRTLDRFLIVLDDIWSPEAWTDFEGIFSKSQLGKGKVVITTQLEEVRGSSNIIRDGSLRVKLPCLTSMESYELLRSEVFGKLACPSQLEDLVKKIAEKCDGLPLLIVMIGKVLKRTSLCSGTLQIQHVLEKASASLSGCLDMEDFWDAINTSLYDKLPYHLRPCFLYIGVFPEGFEIPVQTLMRLWMAEGFVHKMPGKSLEQTAINYLHELINQNLVMIGKTSADSRMIKTCRLHYMLWEFCRKEASIERQNIFQEVKCMGKNKFEPSISNLAKHCRLCINSNVNDFFASHPVCPTVRSFLSFSDKDSQPANISSVPRMLKYLRVLEARSPIFKMSPNDWRKLTLLRYIVFSTDFSFIPKVMSKLRYLQTLIVYTTSTTLKIKANIWKMTELRHVETNVCTKLPNPKKGKEGLELQNLGRISHESCTEDVFNRLGSLQKLSICGHINTVLETKVFRLLYKLKKLKLVNDLSANTSTSHNKSQCLPFPRDFPPNLMSLTLHATKLDWGQMSALEGLLKLEVLKLKDNAFVGESWETKPFGFPELQTLHIVKHNDLITWKASINSLTKLKCLVLCNCSGLEKIPTCLGKNLRKLELKGHFKGSVLDSAKTIEAEKKDLPFDLCIDELQFIPAPTGTEVSNPVT